MDERGVSVEYWAGWFWERAGGRTGFPADIGYAAMSALEVYIEEVDGLTARAAAMRAGWDGEVVDRALRGCVVVNPAGVGILVEEGDDEAQKRFTIAHEVAHYILEVRRWRERAAERMGGGFDGVLYGLREATEAERIDAWLRDVRSEAILHFMDRDPGGGYSCARTMDAECAADYLALEILAPRSDMREALGSHGRMGFVESLDAARRVAEGRYGLPRGIAEMYAGRIVWRMRGGASSAERFGFYPRRARRDAKGSGP